MTMAQEAGLTNKSAPNRKPKARYANKPLDPTRERFAQQVAQGVKVEVAYRNAGYTGGKAAQSQLRYHPLVKARIEWLLDERVRSRFRRRTPGEKKALATQLSDEARILEEYRALAFADPRDVMAWETVPVLDKEGNIIGAENKLIVRPSADLTRAQASTVRGAFLKSGELRLETHDKLKALDSFAKVLRIGQPDTPPQAPSGTQFTLNQVNIGTDAVAAARKVAFLLSAAAAQSKPAGPPVLDLEPARQGKPERDAD